MAGSKRSWKRSETGLLSLFQWIMQLKGRIWLKISQSACSKSSFGNGKGYFAFAKTASAHKNVISILNANLTREIKLYW